MHINQGYSLLIVVGHIFLPLLLVGKERPRTLVVFFLVIGEVEVLRVCVLTKLRIKALFGIKWLPMPGLKLPYVLNGHPTGGTNIYPEDFRIFHLLLELQHKLPSGFVVFRIHHTLDKSKADAIDNGS